jgi:hypothetical protein
VQGLASPWYTVCKWLNVACAWFHFRYQFQTFIYGMGRAFSIPPPLPWLFHALLLAALALVEAIAAVGAAPAEEAEAAVAAGAAGVAVVRAAGAPQVAADAVKLVRPMRQGRPSHPSAGETLRFQGGQLAVFDEPLQE